MWGVWKYWETQMVNWGKKRWIENRKEIGNICLILSSAHTWNVQSNNVGDIILKKSGQDKKEEGGKGRG